MSYQVLARKWRPRNFSEMVGQEHVLQALINALDRDQLHHAFLFTGTRGVGKTTIARILAKSLNCEQGVSSTPCGQCSACQEIDEGRFVDLIEVDAASRTKVEDTRELLDNVQYAPSRGRYKVYLIDEVHMLSNHSFNALLKTLEEPPPHIKFLLATTDPQKLPVTILSRCLQFNLKRLPLELIRDHLAHILASESVEAEPEALLGIARAADGSMRDALSLLDQAIAHGGGKLSAAEVQAMLGSIDRRRIFALLEALNSGDADRLYQEISALAELSPDYAGVLAELNSALHHVALAQVVPGSLDDALEDREAIASLADSMSREDVQLYYQIGVTGRRDLPLAPDPRTGFEMSLLRMLAFRPAEVGTAPRAPRPQKRATAEATAAPQADKPPQAEPPSEPKPVATAVAEPAPAAPSAEPLVEPAKPAVKAGAGDWNSIAEQLEIGGMARQLAMNCAPLEWSEEKVVLALDPGYAQLMGGDREAKLAEALCAHLGKQLHVSIIAQAPASETPLQQQQRQQAERQQQAREAIEGDSMVQSLLDRFEGQILPDSIRPSDD